MALCVDSGVCVYITYKHISLATFGDYVNIYRGGSEEGVENSSPTKWRHLSRRSKFV